MRRSPARAASGARVAAITAALSAAALLAAAPLAHARAQDATIARVAGTTPGFAGDGGPATEAKLDTPRDVAFLPDGTFVIADFNNDRIRRVRADGTIETVAGSGRGYSGDGGPATDAQLDRPRGVTALPDGGFLIADTFNDRIRRVWPDGTITTVVDTGLSRPSDTAMLDDGEMLIADTGHNRIARLAGDGTLSTVDAGILVAPRDVAVLSDGAIVIADTGTSRIVRVAADGTVTTVAGRGTPGLDGDGEPANAAHVDQPYSVAPLAHGGFAFADTGNDRIRRVTPMGTIFTVAGTTRGDSGDGGPAKQAQLDQPGAITQAPGGGLLVADTGNAQVRRLSDIGAVPPAVAGRSIAVEPGSGSVTVRPAELDGYLPLQEEDLVPNGSDVDATTGEIQVTVATSAAGAQIAAALSEGPFRMTQGPAAEPFTDFRLPKLQGCPVPSRRAVIAARRKKKKPKPRRLFVRESGGKWRSSTGSTSASAVGTQWRTTLSCGGTRVTVAEGIVRVRDKRRHTTKVLGAGQSAFVRTPGLHAGE